MFPHITSLILDEKCKKIIILVDQDEDKSVDLERRFESIRLKIDKKIANLVFFNIVRKRIESWLLTAIPDCSKNPEEEKNPEAQLSHCLGRKYRKGLKTTKALAKKISVETMKAKCPSFRLFLRSLSDP